MKKKYKVLIIPILLMTLGAKDNRFTFDSSKLFDGNSKDEYISSFNKLYKLESDALEEKQNEEIIKLTKQTTYLLFGKPNNTNETDSEYYNRYQDYLKLRYAPKIPKDKSTYTGLDEKSQEYKDDIISGFTLPSIFKKVSETRPLYNTYGNIKINETNNFIISSIILPNVKIRDENPDNPKEYMTKKTNIIMHYYYKKLDKEYKLYYLYGDFSDELDEYFEEVQNNETKKSLAITSSNNSKLKEIYNFSKLNAITENELNSIYEKNKNNIVYLNSYYNSGIVASGNGFFINDGLIVTTSTFIKKALEKGQFITINSKDNVYKMDGIVTVNNNSDIAIIKIKDKNNSSVTLSEDRTNVEDPVFVLSSKTGVSHTIDSGIVTSSSGNIQTSISLQKSDAGSMLINKEGNVIGMFTSDGVGKSTSEAIKVDALKEAQDKFKKIEFEKIKAISFDELKEKYFYRKSNKEKIDKTIPKDKWKEFSKVGDIEKNIEMKLVKSSIKNNIISLRYENEISDYMDSMTLATSFKEKLVEEDFEEKLSSESKCIYKSKKYEVIIMKEFNYLIVVMVKL